MKLSDRASKLVEDFDLAAQTHGWESDQGTGKRVDNAREQYMIAKGKLCAYIRKLEKTK